MTPGLAVISPGLFATIQDWGREGYRNRGVPASGALDRVALTLANRLVGNDAGAAALEMLMGGPVLEVVADSVRIAIVGGTAMVTGGAARRELSPGESARLVRGERLAVSPPATLCGYLAIEGGFAVEPILGSASTYVRNSFGAFDGRAIAVGDVLPAAIASVAGRPEIGWAEPLSPGFDQPIRVVLGPQADHFTEEAIRTFLSAPYKVSRHADRMGFRLEGAALAHAGSGNIVSDGTLPGSIQVPGAGQPIVLLADAQTAGGYPKIATVISADLSLLARRGPGREVRFAAVTQDAAERIRREQAAKLDRDIARFRPVTAPAAISAESLYSANLIDGVVSAGD